jgi:DUF438 domain-containing protein
MSTTEAAVMMEALDKAMDRFEKMFQFAVQASMQEKQNDRKFILDVFQAGADSVTNSQPTSSHGIKTLEQNLHIVEQNLEQARTMLRQHDEEIGFLKNAVKLHAK